MSQFTVAKVIGDRVIDQSLLKVRRLALMDQRPKGVFIRIQPKATPQTVEFLRV